MAKKDNGSIYKADSRSKDSKDSKDIQKGLKKKATKRSIKK